MRRQGADRGTIEAALLRFNEERCDPPKDEAVVRELAADVAGRYDPAPEDAVIPGRPRFFVDWDETTKPPTRRLPEPPAREDTAALLEWLTVVLNLHPAHPIKGVTLEGSAQLGHIHLQRAGAPELRFEPASRIAKPLTLIPDLMFQMIPSDGEPYGYTVAHARRIAYVVRLLADTSRIDTIEAEMHGIVGTFTRVGIPVWGQTTYGDSEQRFEAADAMRPELDAHSGRPMGAPRYLVDEQTGELCIRVGDLQTAAREYVGSSLPRGWLDARMQHMGWQRITLQGHRLDAEGRRAGHLFIQAYRGHPDPENPVNPRTDVQEGD
jgi:hypothetical protein